ncbi:hypothetical protein [Desulfobacula sp.]|uniref:hypothetical protein n=1 Tax=Desulfobacula sp. TaxID=2593537 RepID=UPI0026093704|nr:hypothetical protein [Desulfobacula sp.]
MAKNYQLIPGENNNWEVAIFLLIDHLYTPSTQVLHIEFSRVDMHSSINALDFIEKLLGPIDYVVDKTLSNSISSAITRLERNGYLKCEDGQCILTNNGFNRLQEIKGKYVKTNKEPIGLNKELIEAVIKANKKIEKAIKDSKDLSEDQKKEILKKINEV